MKNFIYRNFRGLNEFSFGLIMAAFASSLVYWIGFTRPANVLTLYLFTRLDEFYLRMSGIPAAIRVTLSFIVLGVAYIMAYRWAKHVRGKAGWIILFAGVIAFGFVLLYMAPFDSTDIYDNIMHGRIIAIYHANPYLRTGSNFPLDPFSHYMGWPKDISAYGPLWELVAAGAARLAGNGQVQNLIAFKLLTGVFMLLCTGMIAVILHKKAPGFALSGTLLFAWNPIVLFETFGQGHNDPAMIFWILVAVFALMNNKFVGAVLALVAGGLFKFLPVLFLPAVGLIAWQSLRTMPKRIRFILLAGVLSLLLIVIAYAPFWHGLSTLSADRRSKMFTTSLPSIIFFSLVPKIGFEKTVQLIGPIAGALTVLFALVMGFWAMRSRAPDRFSLASLVTLNFYLLVTILWYWPWYTIWVLGLASLVRNRQLRVLAVLLSFTSIIKDFLVSPLLNWTPHPMAQPWLEIWGTLAVFGLPWLYAIYGLVSYWRENRVTSMDRGRVTVDLDQG